MSNIKVGMTYKNTKGYEYKVIEKLPNSKWKIRFTSTGYEAISQSKEIKNGSIRDWKSPYVCDIGIVGVEIEQPQHHPLYNRWRDMIRRCYDVNNKSYPNYGGKGVTVHKEWLYFPKFVSDISSKENYIELLNNSKQWQIDKDIMCNKLHIEPSIYSNDTTLIIQRSSNIRERNDRLGNPSETNKIKVIQFDCKGNFIKEWNSLIEASMSIGNSSNSSQITNCCNKKAKTFKGYCWRYAKDVSNLSETKQEIITMMNTKRRISDKYRRVIQVFNTNNQIVYEGYINEVMTFLDVTMDCVCNAISRQNKSKGYYIKYKEDGVNE